MTTTCTICGNEEFDSMDVLWPALINEWQLNPREVDYINKQQGRSCTRCRSNLRSIALAKALQSVLGTCEPLQQLSTSEYLIRILEINEAGTLTPVLKRFPRHVLAKYPEVDIHRLPYADQSFDIIVHSDTLEHIEDPVHALAECRRVLKAGGAMCFTVPVIVGRLSRSRAGLEKSYHGNAQECGNDLVVQTEFGADVWTFVLEAGFTQQTLTSIEYPAALAITAWR